MVPEEPIPPLKALHSEETLVTSKLIVFESMATDVLIQSLSPGKPDCLKTRPDGTIIDGHHRIHVLRQRGINCDALPREVIEKEDL